MKIKKILFAFLTLILLCGCYKKDVRVFFDKRDVLYELTDTDKSKIKNNILLDLNSSQDLVFYDSNKSFVSGTYRIDKQDINLFYRRVYLINKSVFYNNKFINTIKIKMNDIKYGEIYLDLSGSYDFKVVDTIAFVNGYVEYNGSAYDYINFLMNDECLRYFSELKGETYTVLEYNSSDVSSNILGRINKKNYGVEFSNFVLTIDISEESAIKIKQ